MGVQKSLFASFKHLVPSDLEYYLEEKNSEGLRLLPLRQSSLFYLLFSEEPPRRYKYVVDCPTLPRVLYMQKLTDEGWEYLGQSMNRYIWRKEYEEGERPKDFSDAAGQYKHCMIHGLIFLLLSFVFLGLFIALSVMLYRENNAQPMEATRMAKYLLVIVLQVPFIICFLIGAKKLLAALNGLKRKMVMRR